MILTDPHDSMADLVTAYVLGAVTPDEARTAAEHLTTCAACRALADETREVRDRLPAIVGEREPSPALKERIMAMVHAEAADTRIPTSATSATQRRRLRPLSIAALGVAAAILLGILDAGSQLLFSPGTHPVSVYAMTGTASWPAARGTLRYKSAGKTLSLDVHHLKPIDTSHVYEVWLIKGKKPVGIGVFHPNTHGNGSFTAVGADVSAYTLAALTVEHAPGSSVPHGHIMAVAPLTK